MLEMLRRLFGFLLNNCGATLNVMSVAGVELDESIPEWWEARLRADAIRRAFWGSRFEGREGSGKPIIVREDFTKKPGDIIHFQVVTQLMGAGRTGANTLAGNEEKLDLGQFDLTVDWIRNAVAFTTRVEKRVNFNLQATIRDLLSTWMSRYIDESMFTQLITTDSPDTLYAGDATSENTLGANDTFGTEEIDRIKLALQRKGAMPIRTSGPVGEELEYFGIVISEVDEYYLKGDDNWVAAQRYAQNRGGNNPLFTGALGEYNGCVLYVHRGVKSANHVQGSPLRPNARLYTALTAASTTVAVGASTATNDYLKFFGQTSGTTYYLQIDNEVISYNGANCGTYQITGVTRGALGTTAAVHSAGALITQRNVATAVGFGQEIAVRGWGMHPQRIMQTEDYGFEIGLGIQAIFGQKAILDSGASTPPNYLICKTYANNPSTI